MFSRNDHKGGAVVTLFAMSVTPKAKCKIERNGNFEAKYIKKLHEMKPCDI